MPETFLSHTIEGQGPAVILLHGLAASRRDWRWLQPLLAQTGWQTLAPDMLGHGDSAKPEQSSLYTGSVVYASLENWIQQLGLASPLVLVGHSLGGYLALEYARRYPKQVRALVLIDPLYARGQVTPLIHLLDRWPDLGKRAMQATPLWLIDLSIKMLSVTGSHYEPEVRRQTALDYKRASPHILRIPVSLPDLTAHLPTLHVPTLVIWGQNDLNLKPGSFPELVKILPQAEGYRVAHCSHEPHLCYPEPVHRRILDFLEKSRERQALTWCPPRDQTNQPEQNLGMTYEDGARLTLRGNSWKVASGQTLQQALESSQVDPGSVLAIRQGSLISGEILLQPGDEIRLVHIIAGG